jgi:FKBP-type peptidyl-prolyl cis-trans isomerase
MILTTLACFAHRRRQLAAAIALLLASSLVTGCGKSKADIRADSLKAAAAAQAKADSIDQVNLVRVDTALAPSLKLDLSKMRKTASGMYVLDKKVGTGAAADSNKWIGVHYTTWLSDGTMLDDTRAKGGKPRKVLLGHKQVVPAWDAALRGVKEGGRRIIVAPPSMGYGIAGKAGSVPRLATLVFDIEVVRVY